MGISEGEELQEYRNAYESGYDDGYERGIETQSRGSPVSNGYQRGWVLGFEQGLLEADYKGDEDAYDSVEPEQYPGTLQATMEQVVEYEEAMLALYPEDLRPLARAADGMAVMEDNEDAVWAVSEAIPDLDREGMEKALEAIAGARFDEVRPLLEECAVERDAAEHTAWLRRATDQLEEWCARYENCQELRCVRQAVETAMRGMAGEKVGDRVISLRKAAMGAKRLLGIVRGLTGRALGGHRSDARLL